MALFTSKGKKCYFVEKNSCTYNPFITFSVPLYNKISFLERFVLSILQFTNTIRNENKTIFEMVIVDSNSNDGSYQFFQNLSIILQKTSNHTNSYDFRSPDYFNIKQFSINGNNHKKSSFSNIPISKANILPYDRSCLNIITIRKNSTLSSNIARKIAVEHSCGKYIWQVDPDDLINTPFLSTIIAQITNHCNIDLFEFGYVGIFLKHFGPFKSYKIIKVEKNNIIIKANYDIVRRFLTSDVNWALWQYIVRSEVYLKSIQTINSLVHEQEKVTFATDLFHFISIIYNSNSTISFPGFGYVYFFNNIGSVSYKALKKKINKKQSATIIFNFLETLFNQTGIKKRASLKIPV